MDDADDDHTRLRTLTCDRAEGGKVVKASASPLLVRVDAGPRIGMGHAMRCLALSQAWQEFRGPVTCMMSAESEGFAARWRKEGISVATLRSVPGTAGDAAETASIASAIDAAWVVVDGYHFSARFQEALRDAGLRVLFIDDEAKERWYAANVVLNQNPHANAALYAHRAADTRLLLGLPFALLRKEFRLVTPRRPRSFEPPYRVLVSMGGADPRGLSPRIIQALLDVRGRLPIAGRIVAGEMNPRFSELKALAAAEPTLELVEASPDMAALMTWADVAIVAAGSTCWELARCGVPALVVAAAENQLPLASYLDHIGAAMNLGWHEGVATSNVARALVDIATDPGRLERMSAIAATLVDGLGALRVIHSITTGLTLRHANVEDARAIWDWANDPAVRHQSFNTAPIPWEAHLKWFMSQLENPDSIILVAEQEDGSSIGVVRFRIKGQEAEIGVNLDANVRGQGLGRRAIGAAVECLFASRQIETVNAYIRPDNQASLRAFEAAGFESRKSTERNGQLACHLVKVRS